MNTKKYQRKLRQCKIDKSRRADFNNKYFNIFNLEINEDNDNTIDDYDYMKQTNEQKIYTITILCKEPYTYKNEEKKNDYSILWEDGFCDRCYNSEHYNFMMWNYNKYKHIKTREIVTKIYKCLHKPIDDDYYNNSQYYDIYYKNTIPSSCFYDTYNIYEILIKKTIFNFKYTYYCLKFKQKFRDWLWLRVRLPNIEKKYHPQQLNAFIEHCQTDEDLFTTLDTW